MGEVLQAVDPESAGEIARRDTAAAAAVRHTIVQLAVKGLDPYSIALRLANRPDEAGGPILKTEGEIERVLDDFLERTARDDAETVKKLRAIENKRLDFLMERLEEALDDGKPSAVKAALSIVDRRAKLNGLDAPRRVEHSGNVGHTILNREAIAAEEEAFRTQHEPFIEGTAAELEP
jgi:hypothetical protein